MSQDIKIFNACDHVVNGTVYDQSLCPKCYAKGYYFDIHFDDDGSAVTTSGSLKLQQEMLKILIDEKYRNPFHPNWGSEIYTIVGHKNLAITKARLEMIVRRALEHLKMVQSNEYMQSGTLTPDEILDRIVYVEISPLGPTGWHVYAVISNSTGQVYSQTVSF